ncbi:MAG TPA: glycerophosphodiester phosphodiesterase [Actinomycetota bacterium]|nr:glycerophosphodiester phosphodiesterase [Actinomycetota bacterium]
MGIRALDDDAFPLVVAHRGASATHPENTLSAFEAALAAGAPLVELDVRLSADRVPVVVHDPEVSRTTDGRGWVHELTLAELRSLNAGTAGRPERIPTLEEVLGAVSGRGGVALEIKNVPGEPAYEGDREPIVDAALAALETTEFEGPVLVLSFNPRSIAAVRRLAPEVPTGLLITGAVEPDAALAHVLEEGHAFVLPGLEALRAAGEPFVGRAHAAGVRVGTWTVDEPDAIRAVLDWGVDAIASNDPESALAVLAGWRG